MKRKPPLDQMSVFTHREGVAMSGNAYKHGSCRCRRCYLLFVTDLEDKLRDGRLSHGVSGYRAGCKCETCRLEWNDYIRPRIRARRKRLKGG